MPSSNTRRKHCIWSSLLFLTVAACILLLYISQVHKGISKETASFADQPAAQSARPIDDGCSQTCVTKECLYHANSLMTTMKPSINPCDNFYSYACGNYDEIFGEDDVDTFKNRNHRKMITALKDVLDNIEANPGTASWKLKAVYDSCMKLGSENGYLTVTLKFLTDMGIGPNWPFLAPDFKFENTSIAAILGNLLAYGEYPLLKIYIKHEGSIDGEKYIAIYPSDKLLHETDISLVHKMILGVLEELGVTSKDSQSTGEMWTEFLRIHNAIYSLYNISRSPELDTTHIPMNYSEEFESKDISEILEAFLNKTTSSKEFNRSHAYISKSNIHFVNNVVPELKQFKDRDVANYLAIHLFWTHGMDVSFSFRLKSWKKSLEKKPFQPPNFSRWEYCVNWLAENMYIPLGHEFVKNVLPDKAFNEITTAVDEHVTEVVKLIDEQEWIKESVKESLKAMIGNIKFYPYMVSLFINETIINEVYKEFNFSSESFFKNILQHQLFTMKKTEELFPWASRYPHSPLQVMARSDNSLVVIMYGMLFPPVYAYNLERIINLFTLGVVIGHEIGHSLYDSFDSYKDKEDNRSFVDFEERVSCLAKQYSEYKFHSLNANLPGDRYEYEAFADVVAIGAIDKMMEKYASSGLSLPGTPFTTEQLLYISLAQIWCTKSNMAVDENFLTTDFHPPMRFRLIGSIQNSKNFAKAFNCTEESYMNPVKKCSVFD